MPREAVELSLRQPSPTALADRRATDRFISSLIAGYCTRHRYWPNAVLHVIGIPLTLGAVYLAWDGRWLLAVTAFVSGYALQALGHALEGSQVGELMVVGRILSRMRSRKTL